MALEIKAKLNALTKVLLRTRDGLINISGNSNPATILSSDNKSLSTSVQHRVDISQRRAEYDDPKTANYTTSTYLEPASTYDVYIGDLTTPVLTNVTSKQLVDQNSGQSIINNITFSMTTSPTEVTISSHILPYEVPVLLVKKDNYMSRTNISEIDMVHLGDTFFYSLTPGTPMFTKTKRITFTVTSSSLDSLNQLKYVDALGRTNILYANSGVLDTNHLQLNMIYSGWDGWNSQYIAQYELIYKGTGLVFITGLYPTDISYNALIAEFLQNNKNWLCMSADGSNYLDTIGGYDLPQSNSPIPSNRLEFTMADDSTFFSIYANVNNKSELVTINGDRNSNANIALKSYTLTPGVLVQIGKINPGVNDGKYFIQTLSSNYDISIAVMCGGKGSKTSNIVNTIGNTLLVNQYFLVGLITKVITPSPSNPFSVTEPSYNFKPSGYKLINNGGGFIINGVANDIKAPMVNNTSYGQMICNASTLEKLVTLVNGFPGYNDLEFGCAILPTGPNGAGEIAFFNQCEQSNWYINLILQVTNQDGSQVVNIPIPIDTRDNLLFKLIPTMDNYSQANGTAGVTVDNPANVSLALVNKFSRNPSNLPINPGAGVTNPNAAASSSTVLINFTMQTPTSVKVDFIMTGVPLSWNYLFTVQSDNPKDTPATYTLNSSSATFTQSLTLTLNSTNSKSVKLTASVVDVNPAGNGLYFNAQKSVFMSPQYGIADFYNAYIKSLSNVGTNTGDGAEGCVSLNNSNFNFTQYGKNAFQLYPNGEWFGKALIKGYLEVDLNNITMAGKNSTPNVHLLKVPIGTMNIASDVRVTMDPQTTMVINYPTDLVSIQGPILEVGDDNGVINRYGDPTTFVNKPYTAPIQKVSTGRQLYIKFDPTLMQQTKVTVAGPGLTNVFSYPRGFMYGLSHQASVNLQTLPKVYPQGLVDMSNYLKGCTGLTSVNMLFIPTANLKYVNSFFEGAKLSSTGSIIGTLGFNTPNLVNATAMFYNSNNIDMDLTGLNVSNIASEPTNFAVSSSFQSSHKPIWGSAPTAPTPPNNSTYQGMIIGIKPGSSVFYITANNVRVRDASGNTLAIVSNKANPTAIPVNSGATTTSYFYIEPLTSMTDKINAPQFKNVDYVVKWHDAGYKITPPDLWSSGTYMMLGNRIVSVPTTQPNVGGYYGFMFYGAKFFNDANIGSWTFNDAIDMTSFMQNAVNFNRPFTNANFGNCGIWVSAFNGATMFNQPLPGLNFGMSTMINYSFTSDLISNVDMMFYNAAAFSQDLTKQCAGNLVKYPYLFSDGSGLVAAQLPVWGTCPLNNMRNWNMVLTKGNTTTLMDNVAVSYLGNSQTYDSIYYAGQSYLTKNNSVDRPYTNVSNQIPLCSGTITLDEGVTRFFASALIYYNSSIVKQINFPSTLLSVEGTIDINMARGCVMVFAGTTPPALVTRSFNSSANLTIKVPSSAVNAYKQASGFSGVVSNIVGY